MDGTGATSPPQLIRHYQFIRLSLHYYNLLSSLCFIGCAKCCRLVPSAIVPKSLSLIALTELVGGEVLRPEGLAIGQLHLVLQPKAIALQEDCDVGRRRRRGRGRKTREPGETLRVQDLTLFQAPFFGESWRIYQFLNIQAGSFGSEKSSERCFQPLRCIFNHDPCDILLFQFNPWLSRGKERRRGAGRKGGENNWSRLCGSSRQQTRGLKLQRQEHIGTFTVSHLCNILSHVEQFKDGNYSF